MTVAGIGHNGGPVIAPPSLLPHDAACLRCQHWKAPHDRDVSAYEYWKATGKGYRIKEPAGACDRVRMTESSAPAFAATKAHGRCFGYEAKPSQPFTQSAPGFVTIYEAGRVVWQGTEGEEPAAFRQQELPL